MDLTTIETPPVNIDTTVDKKPLEYNLVNVLKLRIEGKTMQEIGDIFKVSRQAIDKRLQGIFKLIEPDKLNTYRLNKSNVFTAIELELLNQVMQPDKLKKMSAREAVISFGIIYDKNNIEKGLTPGDDGVIDSNNPHKKQIVMNIENMIINQQPDVKQIDVSPVEEEKE